MDHREETIAAFNRLIQTEDRITECASVMGDSDYILKIAARDPEGLEHFLMRGVLASGLVRASHTSFVLRGTKPTGPWPLL